MEQFGLFVGGDYREPASGTMVDDIDPSTGRALACVAQAGREDVAAALEIARRTASSWATRSPLDRAMVLLRAAELVTEQREQLAELEARDTGKPLAQARADVDAAAGYLHFYGGLADKIYGESIPLPGDAFAITFREPLGVTGHIIPWNYPLQIIARTTAPALAAGNVSVVKPAEEAPLSTLKYAELLTQAGLPPGALAVLPGSGPEAGHALASSREINHLSFTGGTESGRAVLHATADTIVPTTMELGGKSPNIVFEDADLTEAIPTIVKALVQNSGQTCSAGSRLLVAEGIREEVVERVAEVFGSLTLGPGIEDPDVGPLISRRQHERVQGYLDAAEADGARRVGAANPHPEEGFFVAPTLFDGVDPRMRIAREEVFGPVLAVLPFRSDEEALALANGTDFGLIAGVWTQDTDRALWISRKLECGQVYVNSYGAGGGVALPFGGYKQSGFGREKGAEALREYTQVKTVAFRVNGPS